MREFLKQNPDTAAEIDGALRDKLLARKPTAQDAEDVEAAEEAEA